MTGFELRTSGVRSNRSTNWATNTSTKAVTYSPNDSQRFLTVSLNKTIRSEENPPPNAKIIIIEPFAYFVLCTTTASCNSPLLCGSVINNKWNGFFLPRKVLTHSGSIFLHTTYQCAVAFFPIRNKKNIHCNKEEKQFHDIQTFSDKSMKMSSSSSSTYNHCSICKLGFLCVLRSWNRIKRNV